MTDWEYKPARDLELSLKQRINSLERERGIFSTASGWAWWTFASTVLRTWHRFQVTGREHLPKEPPFVMIANHSSHLDVAALMVALPPRLRDRVFSLAAADHFFSRIPKATFTAFAINALPMSRQGDGRGRESLERLRERLVQDKIGIAMFPEGTRSRTGEMGRFRSGVGMLVAGTEVPVVPCYLAGAYDAFPPQASFPRPRPLELIVGESLRFQGETPDKDGCQRVAAALEQAVRSLRR